MKIQTCAECKYDGGLHYVVDDDGNTTVTRPHHDAANLREQARALAELADAEAMGKAREVVAQAAHEMFEFNANTIRDRFDQAGVRESLRGPAFTWAHREGLITPTGRGVPSSEQTTRHRINVWRSVERARALGVAS